MPRANQDWRDLRYREELFFRYFRWRLLVHDLDHSHYCQMLTRNMSVGQRYWFSLLFGMTYRTPQAYAYWWTFQDPDQLDLEEVSRWHTDNWRRTTYGTDARYNKGHFHQQVESILSWKGGTSLEDKIGVLVQSNDPKDNFSKLFDTICGLYRYGRMTAWITCQCLYDTTGLNINFDNVLIRNPVRDSSMQSVWNGYCMLKGDYSRLIGESYGSGKGYKPTEAEVAEVASDIMRYREKAEKYAGRPVDVFKWESVWCQFKRLFKPGESREYPGHSSGDAASRYPYYREHWPEVDWSEFREALLGQPGIIRGQTYVHRYNYLFGETGLLLNMHEMYSDMPNAYEVLGLDPTTNLIRCLFEDQGEEVPGS